MRFLVMITGLAFAVSMPVHADESSEAAVASVQLFHEICMGSVTSPERVQALLNDDRLLPDALADTFRKNLDSAPDSKVWGFRNPSANFAAIINPETDKCELVSDTAFSFEDIREEFIKASQGFASIDGYELSEIETDKSSLMNSLQYSYAVPSKGIKFDIFASVKNGAVNQGQMGSIYTMSVKELGN